MWPFTRRCPASTVFSFMINAASPAQWDAALNRYARLRETWGVHLNALSDYERNMPDISGVDAEHEVLVEISDIWCHREAQALRDLIDIPTDTIADALLKLDLCIENGENAEPALADLRRLTGIARPALDILEAL